MVSSDLKLGHCNPDPSATGTTQPRQAPTRRPGFSLALVMIAMLAGATIGFKVMGESPAAVLGALAGYLVGSRIMGLGGGSVSRAAQRKFPSAWLIFILAAGAWAGIMLMAGWVASRPPGTFHDQGGMIITFVVLPLMLCCWFAGGPVALLSGHYALHQIHAGMRSEGDRRLARTGLVLGWILTLGGPAIVVWKICREASRQ
jgi:hypothetical protein